MAPFSHSPYDVMVIGGGINGAGIAHDASGRGLSVLLCERDDLAAGTSSASTKLIHGGLRYLEHFAFRLVRQALAEREIMLDIAPHIVRPMRFVMPYDARMRPAWMIRLGLFIYDQLGGSRSLPASRPLDLTHGARGRPLKNRFDHGFVYSDCWVDDARLVVLNAVAARILGADIRTRCEVVSAQRADGLWRVSLRDTSSGRLEEISARALVNAAGPWVQQVLTGRLGLAANKRMRLVKGSHIVVPRLFHGEHGYLLQAEDKRVVFALPFEENFTLIGTTEVPVLGDEPMAAPTPEPAEIEYLCAAANRYFSGLVKPEDVVWSYSGIRPLYDDGAKETSAVTRDYRLDLDGGRAAAPVVSVYGGKITTYRRVAEAVLAKLGPYFPAMKSAWTASAILPGGDIGEGLVPFTAGLAREYPELDPALLASYARRYGSLARSVLGDAHNTGDLGRHFGGRLYAREVDWLIREEWARSADDVLWRRTKHGMHLPAAAAAPLERWMANWISGNRPAEGNDPTGGSTGGPDDDSAIVPPPLQPAAAEASMPNQA